MNIINYYNTIINIVGTFRMRENDLAISVPIALEYGYKLFDTSTNYKNEQYLGDILRNELRQRGIKRSDVFITSKLAPKDHGYRLAHRAIQNSLEKLGVDYIDLYLVHWPGASKISPSDPRNSQLRRESWLALEESYLEGKVRAIGVSNYLLHHLIEMESYAKIIPMVNQFELHPAYILHDVISYCNTHNILVQAYSSFGEGNLLKPSFLDQYPCITDIANYHYKLPSQILLRWAIQNGYAIIPKSVSSNHICSNIDIFDFELSPQQLADIDNIHKTYSHKFCWDPIIVSEIDGSTS
jgi:diketogulonate reductase-like aldo/keto reductase